MKKPWQLPVTSLRHNNLATLLRLLQCASLTTASGQSQSEAIERNFALECRAMDIRHKLVEELKTVGLAALFFGCWIAILVLIKKIILAEYDIAFGGISVVLIGTLVLSKVVVLLEHVPLGEWIRNQPAWIDVVVRTVLYALGVCFVLVLEKAFEGRQEYGGFAASLSNVFEHADIHHVWANAIGLSCALLIYNVFSLIRKHFGDGALLRVLLLPLPDESGTNPPER
jgi:hypothetical protein